VRDAHGVIVGEVEPQAARDLLRAQRPDPNGGVPDVRAGGSSTAPEGSGIAVRRRR
jgi:hypothetical protein